MEQITNYIQPELLVLIPALYFIGVGLKKTAMPDRFIPLVLGAAGIGLSIAYVLAVNPLTGWQSVLMALFTAATQGILCAGASVYCNQLYKQLTNKNKDE